MLDDVRGTVSSEFANLVLVHAQLHVAPPTLEALTPKFSEFASQ